MSRLSLLFLIVRWECADWDVEIGKGCSHLPVFLRRTTFSNEGKVKWFRLWSNLLYVLPYNMTYLQPYLSACYMIILLCTPSYNGSTESTICKPFEKNKGISESNLKIPRFQHQSPRWVTSNFWRSFKLVWKCWDMLQRLVANQSRKERKLWEKLEGTQILILITLAPRWLISKFGDFSNHFDALESAARTICKPFAENKGICDQDEFRLVSFKDMSYILESVLGHFLSI